MDRQDHLRPRLAKLRGDLLSNLTRTLLVVLSIAVSVFAVGTIFGARGILEREMTRSFMASNPSSAFLNTDPLDETVMAAVRAVPGVAAVEGRTNLMVRVSVGPEERVSLYLLALPDYANISIDAIFPEEGAWPPPPRGLLLERSFLDDLGVEIGDLLTVETPDGDILQIPVAGTVYDPYKGPFDLGAAGYVTYDTLLWLGGTRDVTEVHLAVAGDPADAARVERAVNQVRDVIERQGPKGKSPYIVAPGQHPLAGALRPILLLMGLLSGVAVLLSGFLVVNTVSALMAQQRRQIGILKAIGARRRQIAGLYLGLILSYSLLALALAIPLALWATHGLTGLLAGLLNVNLVDRSFPLAAVALQALIGLGAPVGAALVPVRSGAAVSVREALAADSTERMRFGAWRVDGLLARVRGLPSLLMLGLRNTVRRPARLALTLITLTLACAIAVAVFSLRDGLMQLQTEAAAFSVDDVNIDFERAYPAEQIVAAARGTPGVAELELWAVTGGRRIRADGSESASIYLWGVPAPTTMVQPRLLAGRWLQPGDTNAIVINEYWGQSESDLRVGDEVVLQIAGRPSTWRVVGLISGVPNRIPPTPSAYLPYKSLAQANGEQGLAATVKVRTTFQDPAGRAQVAEALEGRFKTAGLRTFRAFTAYDAGALRASRRLLTTMSAHYDTQSVTTDSRGARPRRRTAARRPHRDPGFSGDGCGSGRAAGRTATAQRRPGRP